MAARKPAPAPTPGTKVTFKVHDVMGKLTRKETRTIKSVRALKSGLKITLDNGDAFDERGRERIKPGTFTWSKTTKSIEI